MPTRARKVKKSFSISLESQQFLRLVRKERKVSSESETLDILLRELRATEQQHALESAYSKYYDSLSKEDEAEQTAWGSFAETQLIEGAG